jgi:hypothetical protein
VERILKVLPARVGLVPVDTNGRSDTTPLPGELCHYRLDAIAACPYNLVKYGAALRRLLPRVEAGTLTLEEARRQAARWWELAGAFTDRAGFEIADLRKQEGIWVEAPWREDDPGAPIEILSAATANFRPDEYQSFKYTWSVLESRISLAADYSVVEVDPVNPKAGYRTVVRLLGYLGEVSPVFAESAKR